MIEKYYFHQSDQTDLNIYRCGIQECKPGYTWGPGIRDHFIVHYILDGTGMFSNGKIQKKLFPGDGFVVFPDCLVTYSADPENPWTYSWVGFHGLKAETFLNKAGIYRESPFFTYNADNRLRDCLSDMISEARRNTVSELMLLGHLYIFLSILIQNNHKTLQNTSRYMNQEKYVKKVIEFISKNYSEKISISEIARSIGLDRSYLYIIFKKTMKMSPQEYLINYRIERAVSLLRNPDLTIGDVARSVGYEDRLQFSKIFKKVKGISPNQFRKMQNSEPQKN
ncbi:AraC family transcriptional regulator [Thermoclostridium stercorarium]|jgi:AraC-like DNA-binding protein|nr:AraC family transcriptional regulator [Thermoclostridium stercorarium]AGI40217.1 DNA-binding domain-containing protein [Thermoclostridium stercorarium subsp. stercorarium DSM 8532]UZQ85218.1 AraC family transcriptional regulator [Thermoclostridium stercorarium]